MSSLSSSISNKRSGHHCYITPFFFFELVMLLSDNNCHAFLTPTMISSIIPSNNHLPIFYQDDKKYHGGDTTFISSSNNHIKKTTTKKPIVGDIKTLDDLKYFLEEDGDDRLVAVKFFAPWCKTCQRLGKHFNRFALNMADTIEDRKIIQGKIRCAQVECKSAHNFVTEQLYVMALPTLHLYYGTHKIWEASGQTDTKELQQILESLLEKSPEELQTHAESIDDGILVNALEDTMFGTYPSFLDEEW